VVNFEGDPNLPKAFTFEATFDAGIIAAPKVTETLEGDAARQGPQVEALKRFLEAVAAKDMAAIKDAVATGDPMREQVTADDIEMMSSMMFEDGQKQPADILAALTKIYLFDNGTAIAVLQHSETETSTFPLADDNGTWKMGQP